MGDPKKFRKRYDSPRRPWDKQRIIAENDLTEKYGLVSKKEIKVARTMLNGKRSSARRTLSLKPELAAAARSELINSLVKYGILSGEASLDDVLSLKVEDFLERRFETIVFRKGYANSIKQARQFITHGIININGSRVRSPGYLVLKSEEDSLSYYGGVRPKVLDQKMQAPEAHKASKVETPSENEAKQEA